MAQINDIVSNTRRSSLSYFMPMVSHFNFSGKFTLLILATFLLYCLHIISVNVFYVETGKQTIHKTEEKTST